MSNYNPVPPRVWSRVQNPCTFLIPDDTYQTAYIPLTGQTVSLAQANYEMQMLNKGNVLQYKGNSARLTKTQKYSQLARCAGPNRTKVFATQTQTYTNPNMTGLLRLGYTSYPYPNQVVGVPNNISGPFITSVQNPFDCSSNVIQDGGVLVCGTYANPCTGQIIQNNNGSATVCNPASASNVPGSAILCWNNKLDSWFPKPRYFMNNSTSKWPQGHKELVSAVSPNAPFNLTSEYSIGNDYVVLSWEINNLNCLPVSNFNIYQNNQLIKTVPYNITITTVNNIPNCSNLVYYITSLSNEAESSQSNNVSITTYYVESPIITNLAPSNTDNTTEVTIYWSKPSSCAEISYYNIYQDGSLLLSNISSNIYSKLITDLSYCTDYTFNVSYFDSILNIESPLSNPGIITEVPAPPTLSSAVPYNSQVTLTWTSPTISCQQISFNVYYSNGILINSNVTTPYVVTGLTNGQTYEFYIKSYSILNNTYSNESNHLSATLTIPNPPTNVHISSIPNQFTSLQLNWIEPILTQSPPITYNIYTSSNSSPFVYYGNEPYGSAGGSKSIVLTGLNYGTTYQIGIESINTYDISSNTVLSNSLLLPTPNIDISASNYDTNLSNFSQFSDSGAIIFTSIGSSSFNINYAISSLTFTLFAIGGAGSGGHGGNNGGGAFTGGSGGGGGGGFLNIQTLTGGIYSSVNFNVGVGGSSSVSSISSTIITLTGNNGNNGSNGNNASLTSYGSGGSGGSGNGSGGRGSDGGSNNDSNGSTGSPIQYSFIVGGNTYNIYFGGGGGGGAYQQHHAAGGSSCGGQGGTGSGGSGNRTGYGGVYNISSGIASIYVSGGGGGGSGTNTGSGYGGGGGSAGIVGIFWQ